MLQPEQGLGRVLKTQLSLSFWLLGELLLIPALCKRDPIKTTVGLTTKQNAFKGGEKGKFLDPFNKLLLEEKREQQHMEFIRFQRRQPCT